MHRSGVVVTLLSLFGMVRQVAAEPAPAHDKPARGELALGEPTRVEPAHGESVAGEDAALYSCKHHPGQVIVTFKTDPDVKELVTWVMGFTCKNFLLDPRIGATGRKVSIITPNKMTAAEAYRVFLAALSTINLTVVAAGDALRVVEAQAAHKEALPIMKKGMPDDVDQVVRYVYKPSYIGAEPLHQAWQAIKSDAGDVFAIGQVLVITDYASHVREMLSFAKLVDVPGGSDGIYTLPVLHADATKLAEKINGILSLPAGGAGPPRAAPADASKAEATAVPSKILVDERTNTLLVASSDAGYQRVKALVDRLDIALEIEGGSSIHVYPLGSAIAEELAKTLTQAIGDGRGAKPTAGAPPAPPPPSAAAPATTPGNPLDSLGTAIEGQVRVIADPPTNSLIVMSSGRDFFAIRDVIKQLDLPRRQVYIEAMILELDAGNDRTLGTVSHGGAQLPNGPLLLGGIETKDVKSISPSLLQTVGGATGLIGGLIGKTLENSPSLLGQSIPSFAVLFNAVVDQSNANIISAPSIIAIDNVEAKYKVGKKIPVKRSSFTGFGGGTAPPGSLQTTSDLTDFPLSLNIKPHISNDDMVLLEVKHEADELTDETGPTSSTRSLETRVVVHDQETVVLGGLTQEKETHDVTKVPLLGDIPLLGYLFKTTTRTKHKTNLLIMLTPYIIKDHHDLQAIRERKLREHDEFVRSFSTLDHMAYEPQIDYGKKRGVVEEINRSLQDIEQEAAMRGSITKPRGVEAGSVEARPPTEP